MEKGRVIGASPFTNKPIRGVSYFYFFANFRDNRMFLRKKNGMSRQRLTETAKEAWYILDKQSVFGKRPKKHGDGH